MLFAFAIKAFNFKTAGVFGFVNVVQALHSL